MSPGPATPPRTSGRLSRRRCSGIACFPIPPSRWASCRPSPWPCSRSAWWRSRRARRGEILVRGWRLAALGVILAVLFSGRADRQREDRRRGRPSQFRRLPGAAGSLWNLSSVRHPGSPSALAGEALPAAWWQMVLLVGCPWCLCSTAAAPSRRAIPAMRRRCSPPSRRRPTRHKPKAKPVLFLTERQLLTFGTVHAGPLQPEDEKVTLMEMAMARNKPYLARFHEACTVAALWADRQRTSVGPDSRQAPTLLGRRTTHGMKRWRRRSYARTNRSTPPASLPWSCWCRSETRRVARPSAMLSGTGCRWTALTGTGLRVKFSH